MLAAPPNVLAIAASDPTGGAGTMMAVNFDPLGLVGVNASGRVVRKSWE